MWTATMTRPDSLGSVKLWTVAQKSDVEGRAIPAPHERMENQSCTGSSAVDSEWRRHGLELWSLTEYWTLDIGLGSDTSKGGCKLALEDASSDGFRYLGGGILCLIKGSKRGYSFETGAGFHGTVDEDLHASRRIKHIDVRYDLVRDVCDAGKGRVEYYIRTEDQHADLFTKLLGILNLHKMQRQSSI